MEEKRAIIIDFQHPDGMERNYFCSKENENLW